MDETLAAGDVRRGRYRMDMDRLFRAMVMGGVLLGGCEPQASDAPGTDSDDARLDDCCEEICWTEACSCDVGTCCWLTDEGGCREECEPDFDA
jgi:hypothetical protein